MARPTRPNTPPDVDEELEEATPELDKIAAKGKPKSDKDKVLVFYNPGVREMGVFTEVFVLPVKDESKDYETIRLRPGVQEVSAKEWDLWEGSELESVLKAKQAGAIRKLADTSDILEVEQFAGLEAIRSCNTKQLLERWAKSYDKMSPAMQTAMFDKQESMKNEQVLDAPRVLFGRQVGA